MVGLQKGFYGHFGVDLCRGLVCDPEEEEKYVLEVDYRYDHARLNVLNNDSVNFLCDHRQDYVGELRLFYHSL